MKAKRYWLASFALVLPFGCQDAPEGTFREPDQDRQSERARYLEYARQGLSGTSSNGEYRGIVSAEFTNGGFESGDFSGWAVGDNGLSPLDPWQVCPADSCGYFFNNQPIEGTFDALNGFDGEAGYEAFLFQDIEVPAGGGMLSLSDRIQYDGFGITGTAVDGGPSGPDAAPSGPDAAPSGPDAAPSGPDAAPGDIDGGGIPGSLPRTYDLQLRNMNDEILEVLHHEEIVLAGQSYTDLGWRQRTFDVSAYAGQTVRLYARLFVPETFTGPAQFEIDNLTLTEGGGGGGGDTACDVVLDAAPNPATTGNPFVVDMDFTNLGDAFDATVGIVLLADGQISALRTEYDVPISVGFSAMEFPIYSTLALDPLPPSVGFLIVVYDEATRGLLCSDVAIVGVDAAISAAQNESLRQLAIDYLSITTPATMGTMSIMSSSKSLLLRGDVELPF